jgi:hypothetical protein
MALNAREVGEEQWCVTADFLPAALARRSCCRVSWPNAPGIWGNRRTGAGIPGRHQYLAVCLSDCPQVTGLTLPDPAHCRFSLQHSRRLVLAVAPCTALTGGMLLPTAASANHGLILAHVPRPGHAAHLGGQARHIRGRSPGQAAFVLARRIRLRRSAERSSSFKPPQVPYFSGLLTA